MRNFTYLIVVLSVMFSFNVMASSGIFLRGGINNWSADPNWEFVSEGGGIYTLSNKTIKGDFKVANSGWTLDCNYGGDGTPISIGNVYNLVANGQNIKTEKAINATKITLSIQPNGATLKIDGVVEGGGTLDKVYIIGDNNSWNFNDGSAPLSKVQNTNDQFEGKVTFAKGAGELSYWRIYEELGSVGSWGSSDGANMVEHTTTATLKRDSEGCMTTNDGTYKVNFNITTGKVNLTDESGVSSTIIDGIKVIGGFNRISIEGEINSIRVYNIAGSIVSKDQIDINVPAGIYIVVANDRALKVIVK